MRIIRGSHRGRKIHVPGGLPVRPTTDMAKESLFNILGNHFDFETVRVLDLFAGTGNISFEFASRGSLQVVAVDTNFRCVKFISEMAGMLDFSNLTAVKTSAFSFLKMSSQKFDVIFADPPYDMEGIEEIAELVFSNHLLEKEGMLVIEHPKEKDFKNHPQFVDQRKYGMINFSFFKQ
jgi:16S rRNA (guanine966-N2)-methyltransferase